MTDGILSQIVAINFTAGACSVLPAFRNQDTAPEKAKGSGHPRTPEPIGCPRSILPIEFPRSVDVYRPYGIDTQGLFGFSEFFFDAPLTSRIQSAGLTGACTSASRCCPTWLIGGSSISSATAGYDSNNIRSGLEKRNIQPCIPGHRNRKTEIEYDKELYKTRHRIESAFAKLNDWRHIAMHYHRCPKIFLGVIVLATIVKFWL